MNGNGADPKANPAVNCTPIVRIGAAVANPDRVKVARWLEAVEFAIDNPAERIDTLIELADSLETVWLALCERERAA